MSRESPPIRKYIFDAFVRESCLYLVSTYYKYDDPPLHVYMGDTKMEEIGHNEYEPVRYFRCPLNPIEPFPTSVSINGDPYPLTLSAGPSGRAKKGGLAIATLFKYDSLFIREMITWYRAQGCTAFYLYYNGAKLPEGLPQGPDIHYGVWPVTYWNPADWRNKETGWVHLGQTTFLTMARLRFLPDHDWLGLVDIDEHVWPGPGRTLLDALGALSPDTMVACVPCHWARRTVNTVVFNKASEAKYARSKCFYRGAYAGLCGVHRPKDSTHCRMCDDIPMLHCITYSHPARHSLIDNTTAITVPWPA
jgi:hypothetical protein